MEIDTKQVQMMMEIGLLASGYGYFDEAETIFNGLKSARPDSEYPIIGLAINRLNSNKAEEAVGLLRDKALVLNPANDLTKGFLGLAFKLAGFSSDSQAMLEEVVAGDADGQAVEMAKALLKE